MKHMLIVEDERDICDCLREFLSDRGFSVSTVFSGEEAITRLGESTPDVILLDILLPGVTGLEVLKQAKQLHPSARVVMVTALDREDLRVQARSYGACGYVTKPFDFSPTTWSSILQSPPLRPRPANPS